MGTMTFEGLPVEKSNCVSGQSTQSGVPTVMRRVQVRRTTVTAEGRLRRGEGTLARVEEEEDTEEVVQTETSQ